MKFEKHLFISYAHLDNLPLTEQQQGWITRFHKSLFAVLSMRLGTQAEIWRDAKLRENDIFADEIVSQFPKTELLISVITPRYVESEWCTREVREFCKAAEATGGVLVNNKSRVFKVIKFPVDSERPLPEVMKLTLGYPFYILDEQQTPLELDPAFGGELAEKYNFKVLKLAIDVAALIKKIEAAPVAGSDQSPRANPEATSDPKPAVYLAECSYDRRDDREAIEVELGLNGYTVYPDRQLPRDEKPYVAEVSALLERCQLAVHLVGTIYGVVPDGPDEKSVVLLQNELAVQRAKAGKLPRVIWLPKGTRSNFPAQQAFIDLLLNDAEAQFSADLITGDMEELKGAIRAALKKLEVPQPLSESETSDSKLVYLLCDERDRKATLPVRKFLKSRGVESKIPVFEGDAATVRQSNQDLLVRCDAVLLFYGFGDECWKRSVESELQKANSRRLGKPLLASCVYLSEPVSDDKKDLIDLEEPNLIDGLAGFSEAALEPFVRAISSKATGSEGT